MTPINRRHFGLFTLVALLSTLMACAPSPKSLTELLEKNPEIVTNAIDKNPEKFMASIQKAARAAQGQSQKDAQQEEAKRIAAEAKNPLQPVIDEKRGFMGDKSAAITIVEYTDFQCPFCSRGYATLEQVRKTYGGKVRVLVKNLPLPMHPMAVPAAKRFEALKLQDPAKGYAFYHEVFSHQDKLSAPAAESYLDSVVKKVGGNLAKVKKDMESPAVTDLIAADVAEAQKFGISGTPGFIINGVSIRGAYPFETFKGIIDKKLAANP